MAKFCGNCGTQLDDAAKVCGNCGTPLEPTQTVASIPGINYVDPEKQEKTKKAIKWIAILAAVAVVAIIAINIASGFVGYKGVVRKAMKAYKNYDVDTLVAMSSDLYYAMSIDDYADDYFESTLTNTLTYFENQLGHKYKLTYEIVDSYKAKGYQKDAITDALSAYTDFDIASISKIMVVSMELTAKSGKTVATTSLTLTLTKENGSWKILYLQ